MKFSTDRDYLLDELSSRGASWI